MSTSTHTLLSFRGINLEFTEYGESSRILPQVRISSVASVRDGNAIAIGVSAYDLTPIDLANLADQLHLASVQIRDYMASADEGRRFEIDQAIAFGADRLEGDLPNGPENTD